MLEMTAGAAHSYLSNEFYRLKYWEGFSEKEVFTVKVFSYTWKIN